MKEQLFNWQDFGNDIHIGNSEHSNQPGKQTKSHTKEYRRAWYEKNKARIAKEYQDKKAA